MFPRKGRISQKLSPRTIIDGSLPDFNIHCRVPFGAYCQVHRDNVITNTQEPRTVGAIALCPKNMQGGYSFLSLESMQVITGRKWKDLPMPQEVITQIEERAREELKLKKDADTKAQQDLDFRLRDNQVLTGELNLDPTFHPLDISYLDEGADGATPSDEIEYESDSSSSDGEQSANNDTQVEETVEQEQEAIAPEEELQPEQPALPIPETTEQEEGNWLEATEPGMEVEKVNKEDPPEPEYGERHGEIDNENIVESTGVNEQYNLRSREKNQTEATLLHIVNEWRPLDKFGHRYGFAAHMLFVQMSAKKDYRCLEKKLLK